MPEIIRVRNREVPFPKEAVYTIGPFERDILNTINSGKWYNCPPQLRLGGMEDYLNWLNDLTQADHPYHLERGARIILDIRRPWTRLVYQTNPVISTENDLGQSGMVPGLRRPDRFISAILAHSHPIPLPFSPGDLVETIRSINIGAALSTSKENYLLVRTPQTPVEIAQEERERLRSELMDEFLATAEDFKTQTRQMTDKLNSFVPGVGDSYARLLQAYGLRFLHGANPASFFCSLRQNIKVSLRYNLAFYSSTKDGNYTLVGEDKLQRELGRFGEYIQEIYAHLEETFGIRIEVETS